MIKLKQLKIPKGEVLRYLGYKEQNIDESLDNLIDEIIRESKKLILPKFIFGNYKKSNIEDGVLIEETSLILRGKDIKDHLKYSEEVSLMAVTVGSQIEEKIIFYEKANLTKALILDSCATTAVEEICDQVEDYIKEKANERNLGITFRYSPGYGDLSLDIQGKLINTLKADKIIGLTVSDHHLLFPRKSVTAIMGLIPKEKEEKAKGCEVCKNYETCKFRKGGQICGS